MPYQLVGVLNRAFLKRSSSSSVRLRHRESQPPLLPIRPALSYAIKTALPLSPGPCIRLLPLQRTATPPCSWTPGGQGCKAQMRWPLHSLETDASESLRPETGLLDSRSSPYSSKYHFSFAKARSNRPDILSLVIGLPTKIGCPSLSSRKLWNLGSSGMHEVALRKLPSKST